MKAKLGIILFLIILLIITVIKMMQYEESIREEKIITLRVEDETKPLIIEASEEELENSSLTADYYFIASGDYFEVLNNRIEFDKKINTWDEIFLKGVNIGAAVPGKFPAEFSLNFDEYLEWFRLIGEMNANVIRTYTVLPPEFYDAFLFYNLHNQSKKLYLIQGVWAKIPQGNNYYNQAYSRDFKKEIIHVIDLIHGSAVIESGSGGKDDVYVSDISKYVIGILLGREWEPEAVIATNHQNKTDHYTGKFISMNHGTAMEAWLAKMMDFSVLYETQTYNAQRPISFVNWLPLDPMFHNCEFIENEKVREYDNDLESIDFKKFHATELFYPGIYASYHAYPYYPDFIYLQENYKNAKNKDGQTDNYFAYLQDLKAHNKGMPLIIAEYGLPSSRGNSHYTTVGLDQGGHSEAEQAELSVQLTKDIYDTRCGGAIYFEWIDEWFKHNWLVMDFEQPYHNRKLWHNMENPEQNFGIFAYESRSKTIDGEINDWGNSIFAEKETELQADVDAGYFYLAVHLPGLSFEKNNVYVGIDTYDEDKGDHRLPFYEDEIERGLEFLLEFRSMDTARILVDDHYSVFTDIYNDLIPVYASKPNDNALFVEQLMLSNRGRETIFGEKIEAVLHNRSQLQHGNSSVSETSNADWCWNDSTKMLELRLDWHLLNVSDPSGRHVLDDVEGTPEIEYAQTDGFFVSLFVTDKKDHVNEDLSVSDPYFYSWETWEIPEFNTRLKTIYYSLEDYFRDLKPIESLDNPEFLSHEEFTICDFYENRKAAVSLSFDGAGFSQYQSALPELNKYYLKASFGISGYLLQENPGINTNDGGYKLKRLGMNEVKEIFEQGHEISLSASDSYAPENNSTEETASLKETKILLDQSLGSKIRTVQFPFDTIENHEQVMDGSSGLLFGRSGLANTGGNQPGHMNFKYLESTFLTENYPDQYQLDDLLKKGKGKWTIFTYHHLYEPKTSDYILSERRNYNNIYSVSPETFKKQIRLIRNSGYWIAPIATIGKYLSEKENAEIRTSRYSKLIFLTVLTGLDGNVYNQPLTIEYSTAAKKIKISGSASDGVYNNRNGNIYFNVVPNKEVTIEVIE